MGDLFDVLADFSYSGIFLILVALNAAPVLMPPTWIVLSSFYAVDDSLDPFWLAFVGATGATAGRFLLKRISGLFRRFVGKEHQTNLDIIGDYLNRRRYGYVLASFLFAATPLPSNMLFIAYGMMKAKSIGLYVGFWLGRLISYYIMISISTVVLTPFLRLFEDRLIGMLIVDGIGVGIIFLFMSINWSLLITQRKFKIVRPKLWRL